MDDFRVGMQLLRVVKKYYTASQRDPISNLTRHRM